LPTLYHGSNRRFDAPDMSRARDRRDFGIGFYTTTLRAQAAEWAQIVSERFGGEPHLYTFDFDSAGLRMLAFPAISLEWLELVKANRQAGGTQHDYDVVTGPVANDDTMRTIALYVSGVYAADEAMRRLRYFKPNDQVSLHTPAAMSRLEMRGRERV
jgi:hypothetical protein